MEKALQFSNNEKSLIWKRFIEPAKGTPEETEHFLEVCENFGLNPLLGDIVFQRYETKRGAKTQFITTRDGLLRVATSQPGYVGPPNANVVKEGDHFEFLPSEGTVRHKFGAKRGEILGAYAIMQHKKHNPVAVFVDFQEYFQANSGRQNSRYGNPNVWDTLPSAMIIKIAETFVLRRQFPLGGLYTQEEMGLDDTLQTADANETASTVKQQSNQHKVELKTDEKDTSQQRNDVINQEMVVKSYDIKTSSSNKQYGVLSVQSKASNQAVQVLIRDESLMKSLQDVSSGEILNLELYEENSFYFLKDYAERAHQQKDENETKQSGQPANEAEESAQASQVNEQDENTCEVLVQNVQFGKKGSEMFAKISGEIDGNTQLILARGDQAVKQAEGLEQGANVTLSLKKENGFLFLVEVIESSRQQVG
ncbi:RecT family recombinase [Lentibacillus sp. CBA3610]|uniref:RecT family recombinase n=1 Tax=Lentibacillus sp. CBA3610 TaxID=2518176 RepID=UPI0015950367|nr:RecT family recombinase [Lentibacillus sp. CBA3610]